MVDGKEPHVCRLNKALYGLKQAPKAWYSRINGYLMSLGFIKSVADLGMMKDLGLMHYFLGQSG